MQLLAVNFHYIRDDKPERGIYPRSMDEFISQVAELGRHYEFLSQYELVDIIRKKYTPKGNYCLLTFDDNLKEQFSAFEYLEANSIPAIFFSTTLPYLEKKVHDVHKTHHIYTCYSDNELAELLDKRFDFYNANFDENLLINSYNYDQELTKKIKLFLNFILPKESRELFIDELFLGAVESFDAFRRDFYLEEDQLRLLAGKGMLGSHTHDHLPLASLDKEHMKNEIDSSVNYLEKVTGVVIETISYPYGRAGAVNQKVANIARQLGLIAGFTMNRGMNNMTDFTEPLLLKRIDTNDAPGGKLNSTEFFPLQ